MKNIILFFRSNIRRNMSSLIIGIFSGIMLSFAFYFFGSTFKDIEVDKVKVGIIDEDRSSLSEGLITYLVDNIGFEISEETGYSSLTNDLIDKRISAIIEIPHEFEVDGIQSGRIPNVIITTLDDYENKVFLQNYLDSYLGSIQMLIAGSYGDEEKFHELFLEHNKDKNHIEVAPASHISEELMFGKEGLINALGFFTSILFGIGTCIAMIVFEDRQSGVFQRIQASPVKSSQYMIGTSAFAIFTGFLVIAIFCGYIRMTGKPIGISMGSLIPLMGLFVIFVIALSICFALFTNSKNAVTVGTIGVGTVFPILGGAYFPIDFSPETLQNLAKITPHYWFMQAVRNKHENPNADIRINLLILALFALLFLLIGAVKFLQKENKKVLA